MELFLLIIGVILGIVISFLMIKHDDHLVPICVYPLTLSFLCGVVIYFKYIMK